MRHCFGFTKSGKNNCLLTIKICETVSSVVKRERGKDEHTYTYIPDVTYTVLPFFCVFSLSVGLIKDLGVERKECWLKQRDGKSRPRT